jgi:hypothetical protein
VRLNAFSCLQTLLYRPAVVSLMQQGDGFFERTLKRIVFTKKKNHIAEKATIPAKNCKQ